MKQFSSRLAVFFGVAFLAGSALWLAQSSSFAQSSQPIPIDPIFDAPPRNPSPRPMPPVFPPHLFPLPPIPPVDISRSVELQLASQRAVIDINNQTARTKLTQVFTNPTSRTIEGTYLFPLPTGAAVTGFAMTVNGKRVEAEILDGNKARDIYEGIVRKLRDPAILEFADRNTLRARIFPIAPNAQQTIEIEYSQSLAAGASGWKYSLPMRLPVGGAARKASVEMRIRPRQNVRGVYSPSHEIISKIDGEVLRVSGEWTNENADNARDFVLYGTQSKNSVGLNVWTQKVAGEDPYFMLLAAPDPNLNATEIASKNVVFCFDTSGSMSGEKIEQARKALLNLLGNLNANDRFNIVTFSSDVNPFRDALVPANAVNIASAREFAQNIKAVGGTNIDEALRTSLKMFDNNGRAQQLVFMTDGQPTVGETNIETIVSNANQENRSVPYAFNVTTPTGEKAQLPMNARLFTFGVGFDVNTKLLDGLAEENGGASDYVLPNENIETVVGSLYSKIAFPAMSNLSLKWSGAQAYDVYPKTLPALFKGTTQVVFGRLKGATSSTRVSLNGVINSQPVTINGQIAGDNGDNDSIPRLWATRKIGFLLDDSRRNGREPEGEVRDEIIALSKKFGIVTPLTAALITEDESPQIRVGNGAVPSAPMMSRGGSANHIDGSTSSDMSVTYGAYSSTSGESAVRAAKSTAKMKSSTREESRADTRDVAGKTFVLRDGVWTDSLFDAMKKFPIETVKFASPRYFALTKDAKVAKWLSVGQRVMVVVENSVLKIEP